MKTNKKKLGAHLSKELRVRYGTRSVGIRKGDKVKVMRGKFRNSSGKVERVDTKKERLFIDKIKVKKPDGSERYFPIAVSNVVITDPDLADQRRKDLLARKKGKKTPKKGD